MYRNILGSCFQISTMFQQTAHMSALSSLKNVGFIGFGNMGSRMSANLIQKGYDVTLYDKNPTVIEGMQGKCKITNDVRTLAKEVDCIVTMLPAGPDVLDLYIGPSGIINDLKSGALIIDCSTINPEEARKLGPPLKKVGAYYIDAPVSGGIHGASQGTLTFMVGGEESIYEKAKDLLLSMGSNVIYCGGQGNGQVAKVCNNMLLAISMAGLSEAMALGTSLGLDAKLLKNVIDRSSGRCWSSEVYSPVPGTMENVPSNNNYIPGFATKIMLKDLRIANEVAIHQKSPIPLGKRVAQLYEDIARSPLGDLDFSVVYKYLKSHNPK